MEAEKSLLNDDVLPLLGDGASAEDPRVLMCFYNAISAVRQYINKNSIDVIESFPYQIVQLTVYYYESSENMNIQSKSQGGRSITYKNSMDIPDDIKKSLPRYVKPF